MEFSDEIPEAEDLTRATEELGEPDALFQINPARHRTKLIIAISLLGFGLIANYAWWMHGPGKFGHIEVKLLFLPIIIGCGLLIHMWRNRGLTVLVYPTGVLRLRRGEVESYPWDEIFEVYLKGDPAGEFDIRWQDDDRPSRASIPLMAPTFQVWGTWLHIKASDDREAKFSSALADFPDLAATIQQGTFPYLWERAMSLLHQGQSVTFGPITVNTQGIRKGRQFLAWEKIKELSISQKHLAIKRQGGWLPWLTIDLSSVPNPHVLFALFELWRTEPSPEETQDDDQSDGDPHPLQPSVDR